MADGKLGILEKIKEYNLKNPTNKIDTSY